MAPTPPVKSTSPVAGPALLPMGHHEGKPPIRLTRPVYVVGSRSSCRIHLVSSSVSKAHALLVRSNGRTYIRDLASRSKVYVNGDEVREADLADGDLIKIGTFTFQYIASPSENRPNTAAKEAPPAKFDVSGAELPIPIDERVLVIGRRSRCDIHLLEDSVSTSHAVIFEMDGNRYVRDLGSRTGTYVNGVSTHQHMLSPHDTIRVGDNELRYSVSEAGIGTIVEEPTEELKVSDLAAAATEELLAPIEPVEAAESVLPVEEAISAAEPEAVPVAEADVLPIEPEVPDVEEHLDVADILAAPESEEPAELDAIPLEIEPEPATAPEPQPVAEAPVEPEAVSVEVEPESTAPAIEEVAEAQVETDAIPVEVESAEPISPAVEPVVNALIEPEVVPLEAGPAEVVPSSADSVGEVVAETPLIPVVEEPVEVEVAPEAIDEAEPLSIAEEPVVQEAPPEPIEIEPEPEAVTAAVVPLPVSPEVPVEPIVEELSLSEPIAESTSIVIAAATELPDSQLELQVDVPDPIAGAPIEEDASGLHLTHDHGQVIHETSIPLIEESSLEFAVPAPIASEAITEDPSLPLPPVEELPAPAEPEAVLDLNEPAPADLPAPDVQPHSTQLSLDTSAIDAPEPLVTIEAGSREELPLEPIAAGASPAPVVPEPPDAEIPLESPAVAETLVVEQVAVDEQQSEVDLVAPPDQELSAEPILPPEPVEVLDKTEPTPQSALQSTADQLALDALTAVPDAPVIPAANDLSDTQFDRAVREFTGNEIGDLVEPPAAEPLEQAPEAEIAPVEQPEVELPREVTEEAAAETLVEELTAIDEVPETETPAVQLSAEEVPAAPEQPDLPEVLVEEPSIDDIAEAALNEPVAELPLPEAPLPTSEPVAEVPPSAPPPVPNPPVIRPRIPWGANQDNFLGGAPLSLNQPPAPPAPAPAPASERAVRELIKEIDTVAAKAEAAAATPPPAPPAPGIEPPLMPIVPPRPRRAGNPPRRRQQLIVTEETAPPERNLVSTGFDGLANSPLRDMDVFSQPGPQPVDPIHSNDRDAPISIGANGPVARRNGSPSAVAASAIEAEPVEPITPARRSRVTPALAGEANTGGERRPQVSYAAELTEAETTAIRKKYHRRVYLLLLLMIGLLVGSWGVIQNYLGASTTVEGAIRYQNLSALTKLERTDQQRRLLQILAEDGTRRAARAKLLEQPEIGPGFLTDQESYVRVIERASFLEARPDVLVVRVTGHDPDWDAERIKKVLEAQYELNKFLVDDARRARRELETNEETIKRNQMELDRLNSEIAVLRLAGESSPTAQQINQIQAEVQRLEQAWNDAVARVKSAEAELGRLKSAPASPQAGAGGPVAADDPTLRAMMASLEELQKKVDASKSAMSEQAMAARRSLDAALDAFQQQVAQAQGVLGGNPALAAYVQDAQRLQETIRQLTSELIRRQEAQFALLTELKERLNDRMEKRRIEVWQNDKELREYTEKLAVAERQLNAAIGGGLAKEADDKRAEVNLLRSMIKARQELLPGDSFYADAIRDLQGVIDSTRKDIEADRRRTEEVLTSRQQSFVSSQAIRSLPEEQRQLASQLQQKLKEINDARQQYNSAVDAGASDGDAQLKSEMATLQAAIDARRAQLAQQNLQGMQAQQERERQAAILPKQEELEKLKEAEAQASAAYFNKHRELREAQERVAALAGNAEKLNVLLSRKDNIQRELEANIAQIENKKRAVATAVEPMAPTENDITLRPGNDQRWLYFSISAGSIVTIFALLIALTMHAASMEAPAVSIQAADLRPAERGANVPSSDEANTTEKTGDDDEEHQPAAI